MIGEIEGIKIYVNDGTYTKYKKTLEDEIDELQQENKILKENAENNDKVVELLKEENEHLRIQIRVRENVCDRLAGNWNLLKDYIVKKYYMYLPLEASTKSITILIDKIQEIEQGSDSDE